VKDFIRFVLVVDGKDRFILMCSDLDLSAQEIIVIYCHRSKIEGMFLFLKHLLGGFCYRFWTQVLPELKRNQKLDVSKLSKPDLLKIRRTVQAIERHVNLAAIALGSFSTWRLRKPPRSGQDTTVGFEPIPQRSLRRALCKTLSVPNSSLP
jgi:hypothetical protein